MRPASENHTPVRNNAEGHLANEKNNAEAVLECNTSNIKPSKGSKSLLRMVLLFSFLTLFAGVFMVLGDLQGYEEYGHDYAYEVAYDTYYMGICYGPSYSYLYEMGINYISCQENRPPDRQTDMHRRILCGYVCAKLSS